MKKTNTNTRVILSIFTFFLSITAFSQDIIGSWKGTLETQGKEIPLVFNIGKKDGILSSTMDSPQQGAFDIPMDSTLFEEKKLSIVFSQGGIKYEGILDQEKLTGTFYQGGMELSLNLSKTTKKKPGNTSLPSSKETFEKIAAFDDKFYKYSVEDYFKDPATSKFKFSPKGTYVSYREKDENGKNHIYVKHTKSGEITRAIKEQNELIRYYGWANDSRLLYVKDNGGNENFQLFAANLDGSNNKALTPFDEVSVQIIDFLKDQPDQIIVLLNKESKQIFEPYKLNIVSGDLEKLFENKDTTSPILDYRFDKDGNLRGYTKQQNGVDNAIYYRTEKDQPFTHVLTTNWKQTFRVIAFNYNTAYKHDAYVLSNLESNTNELVLYDLAKNEIIEKVYSNPTFDVGGFARSRKRNFEIDYYYYIGEKTRIIPVSDFYKKLHRKFKEQFGDKVFRIVDHTDNEEKYLILLETDRIYGTYYTYDIKEDTFTKILDMMPQLHEEDMAEMRPINFISRDGLKIYGYITIPNNIEGKKVPLILNPHGGPYGLRDHWGFNPKTQLFASRGYATLQVNFRGSGGYGKDFFLKGNKQIGRKMLNDLEDAVAYAKTLDFIDDEKIAIFGASYGGLATLGSLVKTPDLYTCGVDYVGVSNLFTFKDSFPEYWKPFMGQFNEQWYNSENESEQKIMEEVSPALHVDKITKPLFVIQGANDARVNINESDQIVQNMRARGIVCGPPTTSTNLA
ncbi:S9 family peptidase [Zunongwangia endophytica]|uniref:Prolyl oligopeptidase family serine peptidase n=1 Tax=Zunongwangia endophytica TaxID=1808945 RepID=A0ABV8HG91_9FLAO|nr:prolyl oligopeptidase family serine peptidase [Zunongwangia endophytica]MDN3594673.1 prolyl oligopeptidase family serine peptidase [Zunongwangia endophytica]